MVEELTLDVYLLAPHGPGSRPGSGSGASSGRSAPTDMPTVKMTSQRDDSRDVVDQVGIICSGRVPKTKAGGRTPVNREIVTASVARPQPLILQR